MEYGFLFHIKETAIKGNIKEKFAKIAAAASGQIKRVKALLEARKRLLAIDLGNYAIKIALLSPTKTGFMLRSWGYLPLENKPEESPEEKKLGTLNALRAFLIQSGIKNKYAATSVSGNSMIVRYVKFPLLTKSELSATITTEAEPFIPFDVNDVQFGFHILGEAAEEGQKKMETVLVAAKREIISSRVEILQEAGLNPSIIDVDSFALENLFTQFDPSAAEPGGTLYLNIGHSVTNLSIIDAGNTRVVRDIFTAGQTFTRAIMKALNCELAQAESLKRAHALLFDAEQKDAAIAEGRKEDVAISDALMGVLKDLTIEVHRSVDFFLSQGSDRVISRIVLMGGSAALKNLDRYLSLEFKTPVSVLNPLAAIENFQSIPKEITPAFAVAIGLALRKPNDWI